MSDNQQPDHDLLEEALHAFQRMSVPQRPIDAEVLAQFGTRQGGLSQPYRIPIPSKRRFRMYVMVSSTAAVVLLSAGLALFLQNSSPPDPVQVAATAPPDKPGDGAVQPPPKSEKLPVDSLANRLAESQVIVVATAAGSAPAPPEVPGDAPEVLIQFKVKRVLKGELADKVVTTRTSVAPDLLIGKDWVVYLSPEYVAGKHQRAALTAAEFEPRLKEMLKEILAKDKK
jgi:hypothetical protein